MLHSKLYTGVNIFPLHPFCGLIKAFEPIWTNAQLCSVSYVTMTGQSRLQGLLDIQNGGILRPVAILKAEVALGTRLRGDVTTAIAKS